MSDENGQDNGDEDELIEDEDAAIAPPQPVGVVREEIVTVTKDIDREDDLNEVVKAHSDQISRLTEIVESLQSQIKQIDQGRGSGNTTKTKKNKATSKKSKGKKSTKRK